VEKRGQGEGIKGGKERKEKRGSKGEKMTHDSLTD
jgi:hypothetical protein